jgi:hypothetical protein
MKLQKKLYNLAAVENITDRSFNESKRTKNDDISVAKFFQLYDKLFYSIPKVGQLSHSYIINKSNSYAGGIMNNLSQENIDLKNKIIELEAQISDLTVSKDLIEFDKNVKEAENFELKNS